MQTIKLPHISVYYSATQKIAQKIRTYSINYYVNSPEYDMRGHSYKRKLQPLAHQFYQAVAVTSPFCQAISKNFLLTLNMAGHLTLNPASLKV